MTCIVSVLILAMLLWQSFHGGVTTHHLFQKKDMPGISNWWGAILLPALTWILLGKIEHRLKNTVDKKEKSRSWIIFGVGLIFGIAIAVSFTMDFKPVLENVPYILLLLALAIPIFFAEFILGFVFGMTYTFGSVLPTAFILIMAGFGFLLYKFVRPILFKLFTSQVRKTD